jgi:hypothetical protein
VPGLPEEVMQNYEDSLQRYRWSWKAELKMAAGTPSTALLKERCYGWLKNLRQAEGDTDFGWFMLLEKGIGIGKPKMHVLITGLRNRMRFWENQWADLGGSAVITPVDGSKEKMLEMVRTAGRKGDLDCDFDVPTQEDGNYDAFEPPKFTPTSVRIEFVDNLTTITELTKRFKGYGQIREINILASWPSDGGRPVTTATVTFGDEDSAASAARESDAGYLRPQAIRVKVVEP